MSASWVPNVNYAFQPVQNALAMYRQGMDAETRRNDMLAQQDYQQQQDAANMAFRESQAAENTAYRNKQLAMDEKRFKLDSERIGLQNEAMLDERGQRRLTQAAGIAQMIVQEQDPAKKQALYERFIQTDKGLAGKVQGMDADSGAQWIIGLARGYQEPKQPSGGVATYTPQQREQLATQYGLDPSSPEGRAFILTGKMPKAEEQGLSARGEKAVFEADDMIESNRSAIDNLDRAINVNEKAFSSFGPLNDNIGYMMSFTGSEAGKATQELDNIVKTNALESLKATFGGMPTEGERKVLIEVQGSLGQPAEVRAEIYKRAKALAERRLAYNSWKARALRDGTYFTQIPPNFADIVRTESGGDDAKAKIKQKYGLE